MPNWTWNRISCKKEIGDKILDKTKEGYSLDFNKLIKMPDELQIEAGSRGHSGLMYLFIESKNDLDKITINKAYKKLNPFFKNIYDESSYTRLKNDIKKFKEDPDFKNCVELGKQYLENFKKYGHCNWYNWCVENWGTKWNVMDDVEVEYDSEHKEYIVCFNTAWSPPYGIIEEYSKLCSDDEFDWEYENEDYDGHHILKKINGRIYDSVIDTEEDKEDDFEL